MLFRNLQLYKLPAPWDISLVDFRAQLNRFLFRSCGSQDMATVGWMAPTPNGELVHQVGGQWLVALGCEQRILPSSVLNHAAADRATEIEAQQGYKPGRKQMKEIREALLQELLPRAFTKRSRTYAWIDPVDGYLCIDASSRSASEKVIEALSKSLDEFPLVLLNTKRTTASAMTEWVLSGEAPGPFYIDADCDLCSVTEDKSKVKYVHHSLDGGDVRDHIRGGKQVARLALTFDDRISFTLNEKMEVKRLQFLDVIKELQQSEANNAQDQFDADFALMTGELKRLVAALIASLGGLAS